jgi:hypothetical protein
MRQHVDGDAERLQLGHALEHFGGNADLMQAERQRQPADAAAGDEYGHVRSSKPGIVMAWRLGHGQPRKSVGGGGLPSSGWTAAWPGVSLRFSP